MSPPTRRSALRSPDASIWSRSIASKAISSSPASRAERCCYRPRLRPSSRSNASSRSIAQEFSLALPPFPRAPDAVVETAPDEDKADGPFAALARLRRGGPR
jgi:hypothetical protein